MKVCTKCKIKKSIDEFFKNASNKSGYAFRCKSCDKEYQTIYNTTPKRKEVERNSRIKLKERILWRSAKNRAKDKNIEFDISYEDIIIPNVCPILGINIYRDATKNCDNSPSLDRIDNSKGYVKGNVCVISNRANIIKSFGSIEDHQKIIDYMKKHAQK